MYPKIRFCVLQVIPGSDSINPYAGVRLCLSLEGERRWATGEQGGFLGGSRGMDTYSGLTGPLRSNTKRLTPETPSFLPFGPGSQRVPWELSLAQEEVSKA